MTLELWLAFTVAASVLLAVPGPTILLVVGFALRHGTRAALGTVGGVVTGDALAMTLSLAGVGAVLAASATLFTGLKLAGAAYLVWLGVRAWRAPVPDRRIEPPSVAGRVMGRQAFVVTALNPKSIAFFVAFMPQFVTPTAPVLPQLFLLGTTFLVLAALNAAAYAVLAGRLQRRLRDGHALRWANRVGGGFLIGAGLLTATLRRAG
jgi:threonine/homoserine/homoserine lactone efflux protein